VSGLGRLGDGRLQAWVRRRPAAGLGVAAASGLGVGVAAWAPHRLEGDDGLDAPPPRGAG